MNPSSVEPPVEPETKAEQAYQTLRNLIITMKLPPGTLIDERHFSTQMGIGRTPLREAVQRLVQQKLVVSPRRRPSQVAPLELADLQYVYEMRIAVEPEAARIGAQRARESDIDDLGKMLEKYRQAASDGDIDRSIEVDYSFHNAIARATRNPYLVDTAVSRQVV